jgi:hypothetical protein
MISRIAFILGMGVIVSVSSGGVIQAISQSLPLEQQMAHAASRVAETVARYDFVMEQIDNHVDFPTGRDSAYASSTFRIITTQSGLEYEPDVVSRYDTRRFGFEAFEVDVTVRGRRPSFKYQVALGYDGGMYRLAGFAKSDFQHLVRRVFPQVRSEQEAQLIAKWYFGFHDLGYGFHAKRMSSDVDERLRKKLRPTSAAFAGGEYHLTDYWTTIVKEETMIDGTIDCRIGIHKSTITIKKKTCRIVKAKDELVDIVNLTGVPASAYHIEYVY